MNHKFISRYKSLVQTCADDLGIFILPYDIDHSSWFKFYLRWCYRKVVWRPPTFTSRCLRGLLIFVKTVQFWFSKLSTIWYVQNTVAEFRSPVKNTHEIHFIFISHLLFDNRKVYGKLIKKTFPYWIRLSHCFEWKSSDGGLSSDHKLCGTKDYPNWYSSTSVSYFIEKVWRISH